MYYDEMDFRRHVARVGGSWRYGPEARVVHQEAGGSDVGPDDRPGFSPSRRRHTARLSRATRPMSTIGVVVIGRNEGERLRVCLESVVGRGHSVVYVDSGSIDGSVALARALGAAVVELDPSAPFTAARGRNTGADYLERSCPDLVFLQFVDGDCELSAGWVERAVRELESRPNAAVVCGRLHERYPDRSVYNRLADLEWDTPTGEVLACGGIAMMRSAAFRAAGGFDPTLIAGEEPELCLRLRRQHWTVVRIDADMALHDMAMTRFSQWWRRCVRAGHGYAQGAARHGRSSDRHFVRQVRSIWFWGLGLPVAAVGLAWPTWGVSLLLMAGYPLLFDRIRRASRRRGLEPSLAALYAGSCVLAKFPQVFGAIRYRLGNLAGGRG